MRVLVCGGRDFDRKHEVYDALDWLNMQKEGPITEIIEGGATGADRLAQEWARDHRVTSTQVKADWDRYGKLAGPKRNQQMLDLKPDLVLAFPGGKGTANMKKLTLKAGVKLIDMADDSVDPMP